MQKHFVNRKKFVRISTLEKTPPSSSALINKTPQGVFSLAFSADDTQKKRDTLTDIS